MTTVNAREAAGMRTQPIQRACPARCRFLGICQTYPNCVLFYVRAPVPVSQPTKGDTP